MAAGAPRAHFAARSVRRKTRPRTAPRSVVALCARDRGVRGGVGVAAAPGSSLMANALWERLARVFGKSTAADRKAAERILLEADFGVEATEAILAEVSRTPDGDFRAALERAVATVLAPASGADPGALARAATPPTVLLVFGVNGVGKTTTVAKLGQRLIREGRSILLAAADTFRAGATLQLKIWADRLGVPCVTGTGNPAAVAFDAIAAARARSTDTVLVDTAGRLHTEERLLEELKKVVRVVAKQQPGAPHESLLVVDATVGQNAVHQARAFAGAVPLTGLIVTKLDGTAKGGSVVALERAVKVPIRFIGVGEDIEDLEVFEAAGYARRLVSQ